jgi:hypothetical protein
LEKSIFTSPILIIILPRRAKASPDRIPGLRSSFAKKYSSKYVKKGCRAIKITALAILVYSKAVFQRKKCMARKAPASKGFSLKKCPG